MTGLDDLKIARAPLQTPRRAPAWLAWGGAVLLGLSAAVYAGWPSPGLPVRIVTAEAVSGSARAGLDATGYVVARRQATLSAKILGKLVEVNVEEGQHIAKGQIVARLDDSNTAASLRQANALAAQARTGLANAEAIFSRYRRLRAQDAISGDAFENQRLAYDTARTQLGVAEAAVALAQSYENDTVILAPFGGVVTEKSAQIGEIVAPAAAGGGFTRTGIATIVDMDSLEVEVDVSENYIDRVRAGSDAHVRLDAYPDWDIPASVIAVVPTADQSKGTVKVRIAISAKDARILPQMGARVTFQGFPGAAETNPAVQVPADAVKIAGSTGTVYRIADGGDRVEARQVRVGAQAAGTVTLLAGIAAGDRLAAGDLARLTDGARVRPNP
ncbi:MAG TPA: efflux RND transporter periplasmic adaptor subunit [Rhizomicrobium sp.]|jgi:RND family efflux transporter MFP subunit